MRYRYFLLVLCFPLLCAAEPPAFVPAFDLSEPQGAALFAGIRQLRGSQIEQATLKAQTKLSAKTQAESVTAFKKHVQRFAPEWLREFENLDAALKMRSGSVLTLLALRCHAEPERHECTSWVVTPELTCDKRLLLHKNRDASEKFHAPAFIHTKGRFAWVGSCTELFPFPLMGVNEKGLAVAMNNADRYSNWNTSGLDSTMMARILLEQCATADEAAKLLETMRKEGAYVHGKTGSMFFCADAKKAALIELCAHHSQTVFFDFGYMIRANVWHLPGMTGISQAPAAVFAGDAFREYQVRDSLRKAMASGGVTPENCFAVSRLRGGDLKQEKYPVCWDHSTSFATFEMDPEFPELATCYLASGPSRNMVVIPIPFGAGALPADMVSGSWTRRGVEFKKNAGMDHDKLPQMTALEENLCRDYRKVRLEAAKLLRAGKKEQACLLLRRNLLRQFEFSMMEFAKITGVKQNVFL